MPVERLLPGLIFLAVLIGIGVLVAVVLMRRTRTQAKSNPDLPQQMIRGGISGLVIVAVVVFIPGVEPSMKLMAGTLFGLASLTAIGIGTYLKQKTRPS
jgi:hypothetical protein